MLLTRKAKLGLFAFAIFDLLLIYIFVNLFILRSDLEQINELRELGTTLYPEPIPLDNFDLIDQFGKPFTNNELLGKWSLVFFGFTSCPDICPITMSELKQFYERLPETGLTDTPQVLLITVDPARDTPEKMRNYVNSFNENFIGLSDDYESLSKMAAQFFVAHSEPIAHEMNTPATADEYLIEHSGHISVVNPAGELYAVMRVPHRDRDLIRAYQIFADN